MTYRSMTLDGRPHPLRYLGAWAVARSGGIMMWGELLCTCRPNSICARCEAQL